MKLPRFVSFLLIAAGLVLGRDLPVGPGAAGHGAQSCVDGDANGDGTLNLSDPVHLLNFLFLGGDPPVPCRPSAEPVSVAVIVRHAEKGEEGADPGLTPEGQARAKHLADVLAPASACQLIASDLRRTQETLQPLADLKKLEVMRIAEAAEVVAKVQGLPAGSLCVVCHHSYTIPSILEGLGVPDAKDIDVGGANYDNFLVVLRPAGGKAQLLHLKY